MKLFVGIDPSISNTGVVILDSTGKVLEVGNSSEATVPISSDNGLSNIELYANSADSIASHILNTIPNGTKCDIYVVYEDYAFDACNRSFSLGEFGGILKYRLNTYFGNTLHLRYAAPMRIKKFATGSGGAGKGSMKEQAELECPELKGQTSDVCDAFFMAKLAMYLHDSTLAMAMDTGNKLLRHRLTLTHNFLNGEKD